MLGNKKEGIEEQGFTKLLFLYLTASMHVTKMPHFKNEKEPSHRGVGSEILGIFQGSDDRQYQGVKPCVVRG
ncbi:hypothetical protein MKX33_20615 [Paenibacillus sp. FSL R5-0490]|uniref:hypothetical protein n=1 Tax=Paenibacillus sp. FSL R5-0490 TaxID=1920424 RepID=UPI0030CEE539